MYLYIPNRNAKGEISKQKLPLQRDVVFWVTRYIVGLYIITLPQFYTIKSTSTKCVERMFNKT